MDKLNDAFLWVGGLLAGGFSWVLTRLFRSVDLAHNRIDRIENKVVCREHLESQLIPIRNDLNMFLKHLLHHRETEYKDHKITKE